MPATALDLSLAFRNIKNSRRHLGSILEGLGLDFGSFPRGFKLDFRSFPRGFWLDFAVFQQGLGLDSGGLGLHFRSILGAWAVLAAKCVLGGVLGGSWVGLGRVLGPSWGPRWTK